MRSSLSTGSYNSCVRTYISILRIYLWLFSYTGFYRSSGLLLLFVCVTSKSAVDMRKLAYVRAIAVAATASVPADAAAAVGGAYAKWD